MAAAHPLAPVAARRDRVLAAISRTLTHPADGAVLNKVCEAILEVLPKRVQYSAIFRSVNGLIGSAIPDPKTLRDLSWAFAANIQTLRIGDPVWPARLPTVPSPVTLQFLAAKRLPERPGTAAASFSIKYRVKVLQGAGSPIEIDTVLSSRFVRYLSCRPNGLGFARPPRGNRPATAGRPYQHYETLVGMLVRADLSAGEDGRTKIDNLKSTPTMVGYNRSLTEMRWRSDFVCPFNYDHPCHQCPKGQKSCTVATHPNDYLTKFCSECLTESEFDTYWGDLCCRKCAGKFRRRRS